MSHLRRFAPKMGHPVSGGVRCGPPVQLADVNNEFYPLMEEEHQHHGYECDSSDGYHSEGEKSPC